jgi:hypothetical protein
MFKKHLLARTGLLVFFILLTGLVLPVASWTGIAQAVGYSCNESGLDAALAAGGTATFNCASPTTIVVSGTKTVTRDVTLDGGNLLTLSGGNARQILVVQTTKSLTVQNVILRDGFANGSGASGNGGAIRANSSLTTVTVINSQLINNRSTPSVSGADYGGGAIFSQGGTVVVSNSTFSGNISNGSSGGAIHGLRSNISITNSTFSGNQANGNGGYGGAIYYDGAIQNGFVTIQGSTFTGNTANGEGGAVKGYMYQGTDYTLVDRSSFINNSSSPEPDGHSLAGALKFVNFYF